MGGRGVYQGEKAKVADFAQYLLTTIARQRSRALVMASLSSRQMIAGLRPISVSLILHHTQTANTLTRITLHRHRTWTREHAGTGQIIGVSDNLQEL